MKREVTIRDVAQAARVSPSTVSNLLNGRDARMRPGTRERITRTIHELGYRPSRVARQLRTGRAHVVGLVVPSVANPFWGSFARAVESAAAAHDRQVLLCNSERDPDRERGYVEELWAGGARSVVLGTSLPSLDHLASFVERGLRLVAFDREPQPADPVSLRGVSVDNRCGGRLATRHLLELGHTRIAFLSGAIATVSRQRRLAGYTEALTDAGITVRAEFVWADEGVGYGDTDAAELGRRGMQTLLALPEPPTAVVAINDMYAMGACAAVRAAGLAVPGTPGEPGVSVVGFDDVMLAGLFHPPLTTVRQPLTEMAAAALAALDEMERDGEEVAEGDDAHNADGPHEGTAATDLPVEAPRRSVLMTPELVVRSSTVALDSPRARP
ncbi:LacI family DNA-binding transcriptional regulator [Actinopolymorpha pittospori]